MNVNGKHYQTIWLNESNTVSIIDQRFLPHRFVVEELRTVDDIVIAIKEMHLRGAGLIGAAAGFGMYLSTMEAKHEVSFEDYIFQTANRLKGSRPTAVNLEWAVNRQLCEIARGKTVEEKIAIAKQTALDIAREDIDDGKRIGGHGAKIIETISRAKKGDVVNILTHCNAGWLAFVDYGSALSPIYTAFDRGIKLHVWVDETRPRNQGAGLTAWELLNHGVPHSVIVDNAGGHLMQHGMVDMVITGADRVTRTGDAANKIGTYLKALAAKDNGIPFYVAIPSSSIDWDLIDGINEIPIEERDAGEVKYICGFCDQGIKQVLVTPANSPARNWGFDVTPARLITGFITERGVCGANEKEILAMFPERA